jgi:hypothetical protein
MPPMLTLPPRDPLKESLLYLSYQFLVPLSKLAILGKF